MTMPKLRDILNDTEADATDIEFNYNTIETYINTEVISRDGSVTMSGPLILSDGLPAISAASLGLPIGMTVDWPVTDDPVSFPDWLVCDGRILNVAQYPTLYSIIGSTFNEPGDNFSGVQFRLPNYSRRVSVGADGSNNFEIGDQGGSPDAVAARHSHTATFSGNQLPEHTHNAARPEIEGVSSSPGGNLVSGSNQPPDEVQYRSAGRPSGSVTVHQGGEDGSGKNYPPYLAMAKLMKVK